MKMRNLVFAVSMAFASTQAFANGSIIVTEPGADTFNIETLGFNGSSYDIIKLTFDFTGTTTSDGSYLVIDGTPDVTRLPSGSSVTFSGSGAIFSFTFDSFSTFDTFAFTWDPDSAINDEYGATGLDFIGGKVTAETSNGLFYSGIFAKVGATPDVAAVLVPVPEPSSYGMLALGIGLVGFAAHRRKSA